jgi:hypothetical protein
LVQLLFEQFGVGTNAGFPRVVDQKMSGEHNARIERV